MKHLSLALPALLALAACDGGTQSADVSAEEAAADGTIVGNSSAAPAPGAEPDAAADPSAAATPGPAPTEG